jgi:hypothetical protein
VLDLKGRATSLADHALRPTRRAFIPARADHRPIILQLVRGSGLPVAAAAMYNFYDPMMGGHFEATYRAFPLAFIDKQR